MPMWTAEMIIIIFFSLSFCFHVCRILPHLPFLYLRWLCAFVMVRGRRKKMLTSTSSSSKMHIVSLTVCVCVRSQWRRRRRRRRSGSRGSLRFDWREPTRAICLLNENERRRGRDRHNKKKWSVCGSSERVSQWMRWKKNVKPIFTLHQVWVMK